MTAIFQSKIAYSICIGIIFGMACWDIALEGQVILDPQAMDSIYHFYRVLGSETNPSPILLFLLISTLYIVIYLIVRVSRFKELASIIALVSFAILLGIELAIAVPAEMKVVAMGLPSSLPVSEHALVQELIIISRNVHLCMLVLLAISLLGSRNIKK